MRRTEQTREENQGRMMWNAPFLLLLLLLVCFDRKNDAVWSSRASQYASGPLLLKTSENYCNQKDEGSGRYWSVNGGSLVWVGCILI